MNRQGTSKKKGLEEREGWMVEEGKERSDE